LFSFLGRWRAAIGGVRGESGDVLSRLDSPFDVTQPPAQRDASFNQAVDNQKLRFAFLSLDATDAKKR